MRDGSRTEGLAEVADVGTQCCPESQQDGNCGSNSCSEDKCDDPGRRLRVFAEDVMNLGFGSVAKRRFRNREGHVGIAGDGQVKNLLLVGRRRAECSNDDRCGDWLGGNEELVGKVLLRLPVVSIAGCN